MSASRPRRGSQLAAAQREALRDSQAYQDAVSPA